MSPTQVGELPVIGTLTYRARIALPADTRAVVEVREGDGPDGPVVAERRIDLEGKQVPIVFELRVDRARLAADRRYFARGGLIVEGRPAWATEPVALDVTQRSIELGTLEMLPVRATAFASTLRCGDEHATVGWVGEDTAELTFGGELFRLKRARSGSGARYEAPGDSTTWLWNKGDRTTISVRGETHPECTIEEAVDETFRAHGNEPFWGLEITRTTLTFRTPDGRPVTLPSPRPTLAAGSRRYAARGDGHDLAATVTDRICTDDMSGMPYPSTVTVVLDGREYRGCGGEPAAVLQGKEWVVEDVDSADIIDRSRLTLNFSADKRVFGRAGCNTYSGRYTLTGESLTVASPVTTLKACAESLMRQEDRFLKVLADVRRFEITPTGALVLHADDGRSITARR
ncbi:MAG TPA: META domain-containing protein [Gemmatimonadales bacterium]|nr:META domain-containing protein [Gemmatimonadales bacterium]